MYRGPEPRYGAERYGPGTGCWTPRDRHRAPGRTCRAQAPEPLMCATDRPWTAGSAGQPQPAPTTGCNDAASAQHHDPAASSIHGPNGSTNAGEDNRGGSGAMCAADADADRRQCRGLKVAESYLRVAYCDGTGHPLRSALWIKVAFAHLWFRTRPGNPHSTRVGSRLSWNDVGVGPAACRPGPTPRGSGSTGQGLSILHEPPTPMQYTQPSPSSTPTSCSTPPAGLTLHREAASASSLAQKTSLHHRRRLDGAQAGPLGTRPGPIW